MNSYYDDPERSIPQLLKRIEELEETVERLTSSMEMWKAIAQDQLKKTRPKE